MTSLCRCFERSLTIAFRRRHIEYCFSVLSTLSRKIKELSTFTIIILTISLLVYLGITMSRGQQQESSPSVQRSLIEQEAEISQQVSNNTTLVPNLNNSKLEVELVTEGFKYPTSMAFIGNHGDMLILEKGGEVILFSKENKTKIPY